MSDIGTEAWWLAEKDPAPMLEWLIQQEKLSDRKARLLAVACCRRLLPLLPDERSQSALGCAERLADGVAAEAEVRTALAEADQARSEAHRAEYCAEAKANFTSTPEYLAVLAEFEAALAAVHILGPLDASGLPETLAIAVSSVGCQPAPDPIEEEAAYREALRADEGDWKTALQAVRDARQRAKIAMRRLTEARERAVQASLLRHLVGNPFTPQSVRPHVPEVVLRLAEALYTDTDCASQLHDALIDAGLPELAAHYTEPWHPKGCWALDVILGRE